MAQSVVINEIVYSSVPAIEVPKSNGGTAKFYDTSDANLASADLPVGKKGYGSNGLELKCIIVRVAGVIL